MVAPAAAYALYLGIAALVAACSSSTEKQQDAASPFQKDAGSVDDIATTDSASAESDSDTLASSDSSAPQDTSTYVDVGTIPSSCPSFPLKGSMTLLGTLPCGSDIGFISDIDADGNGACTDLKQSQSWFFKFDAKGITSQTPETKLLDQVAGGAGNLYYTGMDGQKGSYGVGLKTGAANIFKPFPATTVSGQSFTPSFGKGVLWYAGKLFVTSSNVSFTSGAPKYYPGTVTVYNANISSAPQTVPTDGTNATSIGVAEQNGKAVVVVINSGDYNTLKDPTAPEHVSSITLIDPDTLTIRPGPSLSNMRGLGISGEISSVGSRFVLGSGDSSGKVVVVDLETNTVQTIETDNGKLAPHFISATLLFPNGKQLVTGDYNTGALRQWNLTSGTASEAGTPIVLDKSLSDNAGISDTACMGGKLYVAVGKSIWMVE